MITREDVVLTEHRLTEPSKVKLNFGAPVTKKEGCRLTLLEACIFGELETEFPEEVYLISPYERNIP